MLELDLIEAKIASRDVAPSVENEVEKVRLSVESLAAFLELEELLPAHPLELPAEVRNLLGADEATIWPSLEDSARRRLLSNSAQRRLASAQRRLVAAQRSDLCGRYIDLLYQLGHTRRAEVGEEAYEQLRSRMEDAKAAWENLKVKPARKGSEA